ncbi:metallophosphoesterase family protein [Planomicrobium sp. Y74]|uniref:metallophosphoesterase family protein n=1 Tax=Planomicrobium sp. Y74 TaxID=2478977 RepID=UPI000EF490D2|nr:metallophosphoesterase family protein [Planomicrobium sp. Y74]RLQ92758.1 metallophosphoesterase [Planomicrobium sp. Y74]
MTRIAIISDIHGNIYALEAVLEDMKEKAIDSVYCLGDMIGIGPFSNEVLEALFAMDNMQMITGNHEESILAVLTNEPYPKSRVNVKPHHEWIASRLKDEFIEGLLKLPRQLNKTFDEHNIQFIHYPMNPSSSNDPISQDPFDQLGVPSVENFAHLQGLENTELVCFGHDHSHHLFTCNNTTFYNTGSLGYSSKAFARYGIIEINKNGYHISQINVPYDLEKYVHGLTNSSVPRKEIILRMYS